MARLALLAAAPQCCPAITMVTCRTMTWEPSAATRLQFWAEDGKSMQGYVDGFREAAKKVQAAPNRTVILDHSQVKLGVLKLGMCSACPSGWGRAHPHDCSLVLTPCLLCVCLELIRILLGSSGQGAQVGYAKSNAASSLQRMQAGGTA